MSDSEDDKPLAARAGPAPRPAAAANGHSAGADGDPVRRKAAQKAPIIDESDSEDDKPLGGQAVAAKPAPRPSE